MFKFLKAVTALKLTGDMTDTQAGKQTDTHTHTHTAFYSLGFHIHFRNCFVPQNIISTRRFFDPINIELFKFPHPINGL